MPINISTSTTIFAWRPTAWLQVVGPDAANFLQGQFTQDLRLLDNARTVYGLWLNVKGKVLADSFVLRGASRDEYWIGSYYSSAAVIRERLDSFLIADDVTIDDRTSEWAGLSIIGSSAETLLAQPPAEGFVFRGRRSRSLNVEWVFPNALSGTIRNRFPEAVEYTPEDIARLRFTAAIPAVPVDIGSSDLPNEAGLEVDAISYTKGCYLGQEVMARLKSMGHVRRRLLRVAVEDREVPALPARLFATGRNVGELRSVVADTGGLSGFAMLSLPNITAESKLAFTPDGPAKIRLIDAP